MYNRYVQDTDGTFHKESIPEQSKKPFPMPDPPIKEIPKELPSDGTSIFRSLDFGDLITIFILLFIAGDNEEHRDLTLLTLMFYFLL